MQEYLKNPERKKFIVGSPEDTESIKWMQRITELHGIKWYTLKNEDKNKIVSYDFINAIAESLI